MSQRLNDAQTAETVFIIGPDKNIKASLSHPMSKGRNFSEIPRLLDSSRLTAERRLTTPADRKQGDDVIVSPAVSDEEAERRFPEGWRQSLPYIRFVGQPQ